MGSIGRRLDLRSHEPWFALGGLVVLRPKRSLAAPSIVNRPRAAQPSPDWLAATLTFGSPFDARPATLAEARGLRR